METINELKALKEEYKNIFAELNAKLDNKIAELEKVEQQTGRKWKPELNGRYWFIDDEGNTFFSRWDDDAIDNSRYKFGNVFKTEEEADFTAEQLKVLTELKEYADDDREWDNNNRHWCIQYDADDRRMYVNVYNFTIKVPFKFYFSSDKQAQKAIDAIGVDRLKKYYFCVEE